MPSNFPSPLRNDDHQTQRPKVFFSTSNSNSNSSNNNPEVSLLCLSIKLCLHATAFADKSCRSNGFLTSSTLLGFFSTDTTASLTGPLQAEWSQIHPTVAPNIQGSQGLRSITLSCPPNAKKLIQSKLSQDVERLPGNRPRTSADEAYTQIWGRAIPITAKHLVVLQGRLDGSDSEDVTAWFGS